MSIYVRPEDRYIVKLEAGYQHSEHVKNPIQAAAAALRLVTNEDRDGTIWEVFDRETGETFEFKQGEIKNHRNCPGVFE